MFRLFCDKVVHLKLGDSKTSLGLLDTIPFLFRSISTCTNDCQNSFKVSYLINSCGLSPEKAISVSKKIHFENSTQPDSVLTLLRNYGFTNTQISNFVAKAPQLLVYNPDKTLKPKFDFFQSLGLSDHNLAKLLSSHPYHLRGSLKNQIIPGIAFLKTIVHTNNNVVTALNRSMYILQKKQNAYLAANVAILRNQGIPDSNISYLILYNTSASLVAVHKLEKTIKEVMKMKFNPLGSPFVKAVRALGYLSESSREAKFNVCKKWGWSEDDIYSAFRREPNFFCLSEKNIMQKMKFFVNEMGFNTLLMVKYPLILMFSMEKRIIPRCSVIKILISKGLVEKDSVITRMLIVSDKVFLEKFVTRFEKEAPNLLKVYQEKSMV
ncbi:Mitochondrial transcription termination factor family protein [Thalictrum thalictroides]|uniref:Mitochondrial transcription termination factor family protein n=1 Tax=Thalictrum thalictroides TaxID=46969 RepID=A0A7J6X0Z5_THATH|nr:Mitochondrial transcription termination factor family protein [Thalictrum thalictroides]